MIVKWGKETVERDKKKEHQFKRVVRKIMEERQRKRQKAKSIDNRLHPALIVGDRKYRRLSYRLEEIPLQRSPKAFFSLTRHGVQYNAFAVTSCPSPQAQNKTIHSHSNLFKRPSRQQHHSPEFESLTPSAYSVSLEEAVKKSHNDCLITQSCHFQTKSKTPTSKSSKLAFKDNAIRVKRIENYKKFGTPQRPARIKTQEQSNDKYQEFVPWQTDPMVEMDSMGVEQL